MSHNIIDEVNSGPGDVRANGMESLKNAGNDGFLTKSIDKYVLFAYFLIVSPLWSMTGYWSVHNDLDMLKSQIPEMKSEYLKYAFAVGISEIIRIIYCVLVGVTLIRFGAARINHAYIYMKFYMAYWIVAAVIFNYWHKNFTGIIHSYDLITCISGQILGALIVYVFINRSLDIFEKSR